MNTFGARLRQARLDGALTQEALALDLGVSKASVSAWETDRDFPRMQHLEPLRILLGVDLDFLICDSVAKFRIADRHLGAREATAGYAGAGEQWLSPRETRVLSAWRAMSVERQDAVLVLMQSNLQDGKQKGLDSREKKSRPTSKIKKPAGRGRSSA